MTHLVNVKNLKIQAVSDSGRITKIIRDVSFSIKKGEVVALIGESGSGKTTIALSLLGYVRPGCSFVGGEIQVEEDDLLKSDHLITSIRGQKVAYIPQSAAASFNPSKTLMSQVIEITHIHNLMPADEAEVKAVELFKALALPDPQNLGKRYPHQVSGGQLQRVSAAMALIGGPSLVIFDEPTTALDVTTQIEVLRAFKSVMKEMQITGLYVSHDLAVVAQVADTIIVLKEGEIQESGPVDQILNSPQHIYTKQLLSASEPAIHTNPTAENEKEDTSPLLNVSNITAGYGAVNSSGLPRVTVLHDVSFTLQPGENLGVVGESGCGKSTLARVISGLLPSAKGQVELAGSLLPPSLKQRSKEQLRRVQIVFQMADTALNPRRSVGSILRRPLTFYHGLSGKKREARVMELLDLVHLSAHIANRLPGELSGGQKQRINLARALAAEPELILCDEVTSALDTVVTVAILDLLAELQRELNISYMFISHDLATVRSICDHVLVLYAGCKVELGERAQMKDAPLHPYTDLLISSIPELRSDWLENIPPDNENATTITDAMVRAGEGLCPFFGRCKTPIPGTCNQVRPPLRKTKNDGEVICHHDINSLEHVRAIN